MGRISLVGAGPGDIELLTIKGKRRLQEADVIVYDRLANKELLRLGKPNCEYIYVGKEPEFHPVPQSQIEEVLIQKVRENKNVVRLKGGDPYVFGRGGEEGKSLVKAGIPFEVIPGITSAIGGLAYAGIPITYRNIATSFHVITAHRSAEGAELEWENLAQLKGTLVFLMGVSQLSSICERLIKFGKDQRTPTAIVHWATSSKQKTVIGNLTDIYEKARAAKIESPSLIVVGEVVNFREELSVFETQPLFGETILFPYAKNSSFINNFMDQGASVSTFSRRKLIPQSFEITKKDCQTRNSFVFLDQNSWQEFLKKITEQTIDIRYLKNKLIAVGHHTKITMKQSGVLVDAYYSSKDEVKWMKEMVVFGSKEDCEKIELENTELVSKIVADSQIEDTYQAQLGECTVICLPHSKAAEDLLAIYPAKDLKKMDIIVLGEMTGKVLDKQDIPYKVTVEATFEGMLEKIKELRQ